MDYSLLLGIHDVQRGEAEGFEGGAADDGDSAGDDSGTDAPWGTTPPDSPHQLTRDASLQYDTGIVPELDIYAIPSSESMLIKIKHSLSLNF